MIKKNTIFLILTIIIAFALRIYAIQNNPPALSWDEVSIGYNAYSILKTGKDEHGKVLPLDAFAGYGDYKPPLSIYITVPFVALLGLNELSVRLPSAIFGIMTIIAIYLFIHELFRDKFKDTFQLAFITTILLTFSPWHINLSRAGFEANIALFFIILGTYFVFKSRINDKYLLICWIPFVAAIYTFNSSRYFAPILALGLCVYCYGFLSKHIRFFILGIIIAVIFLIPITPHLLSKEARLRFKEVNIFTDISVVKVANDRIAYEKNSFLSRFVDNRRVGYLRSFLMHYFDNLEPNFLFIKGDGNPKFSTQDVGQMYLVEAPFFSIGFLSLFLIYPHIAALLFYWLLTAIIPAAVARETPHALRILDTLPTWQIFIGFGFLTVFKYLQNKQVWLSKIFLGIIISVYSISTVYYLYNYHIHYPREFSSEWEFGYKDAILAIQPYTKLYNHIAVTESIGRPYMYVLFYTKYDPSRFINHKQAFFDADGFYHVVTFDKFEFINKNPEKVTEPTIIIGEPYWFRPSDKLIKTVNQLDGTPVLSVFIRNR